MIRGIIHHPEYKNKIIDASGLRYGNITGTDLDFYMDMGNVLSIFIELKFEAVGDVIGGQRLALERLVDDVGKSKHSLLIVATHSQTTGDIKIADCPVRRIYTGGRWKQVCSRTVAQIIDSALLAANINPKTGKVNYSVS
jgi:hypothetical protein